MSEEKDVLKKLLIDEQDTAKDLATLVEKATKIFRIEKSSGRVIFQSFDGLTDRQRIVATLVGKYFALKLGIATIAALTISELADEISRPVTALSGPIKVLMSNGFVLKTTDRKYQIAYHRINEIFERVLQSKEKQ